MNTEVLTISVDSPATHKDWNEKELSRMVEGGARYPMLSDRGGESGISSEFMMSTRDWIVVVTS